MGNRNPWMASQMYFAMIAKQPALVEWVVKSALGNGKSEREVRRPGRGLIVWWVSVASSALRMRYRAALVWAASQWRARVRSDGPLWMAHGLLLRCAGEHCKALGLSRQTGRWRGVICTA